MFSLAANAVLWQRGGSADKAPAPSTVAEKTSPAPVPSNDARAALEVPPELSAFAGLGTYVAATNRIPDLGWTEEQFAAFAAGLRACYAGRPYPFDDSAKQLREQINEKVRSMMGSQPRDPVEQYFSLLREKEAVQRTSSNLHYRITEEGTGAAPTATDTVVVSYAARLPDGKTLPTLARARVRVRANDLLPGLREGVQLMRAGGKALLYLPPQLSFAPASWPAEVPRGAPVAFFVELHEVVAEEW